MTKNIFHDASVKLAGLYLLVIIFISIVFSFWLYNVSISEIRQSILRVPGPIQRVLLDDNPNFARELRLSQDQAVEDARDTLIYQLVLLNIFIAVAGATISYLLARRTLRPIEEAHDAQSRFTADASHELRTPITALRAETELTLTEPKLTLDIAKEQLVSNIEELDKLTSLSEGLLQLARLDDSGLEMQELNLKPLVEQAIARVIPLAEKNHQIIKPKLSKITLKANEQALLETVVVLLDNAVKYSPEKTEISISIVKQKNSVLIQVSDKGIGINATDLEHIFERFYRSDTSRDKNKTSGFGIGLSIAKATIDAHGGKISVKSAPSKGSTFTISLPS